MAEALSKRFENAFALLERAGWEPITDIYPPMFPSHGVIGDRFQDESVPPAGRDLSLGDRFVPPTVSFDATFKQYLSDRLKRPSDSD